MFPLKRIYYQKHFLSRISKTYQCSPKDFQIVPWTAHPSGAPKFTPGFKCGSCYSIFSFICMFSWSLFVLLYFFFWPLCCLFFFDVRILIAPLVSSNSSRFNLLFCVYLVGLYCFTGLYRQVFTTILGTCIVQMYPHWHVFVLNDQ